ncbi:hypothetical protein TIFTF001_013123 [Ficus carica]|uniref:Uncharacterized protein n=1 Tax=Ficus carica TaxID=3494 RepID=A0AA88D4A9_FICCA|nr:hypothetical protein TIFTF001_013123 [Ficus carica]
MFATSRVNGVRITRFRHDFLRIVIVGVRIASFRCDLFQVTIAKVGITSFCCILLRNLSLLSRDLDKSGHSDEVGAGL